MSSFLYFRWKKKKKCWERNLNHFACTKLEVKAKLSNFSYATFTTVVHFRKYLKISYNWVFHFTIIRWRWILTKLISELHFEWRSIKLSLELFFLKLSGIGADDVGGGGLVDKTCPTLANPWAIACQASLLMGFSRQEYWSGLPFPSPGYLSDPGIEPRSPALQADPLPTELWGKPISGFGPFH